MWVGHIGARTRNLMNTYIIYSVILYLCIHISFVCCYKYILFFVLVFFQYLVRLLALSPEYKSMVEV